VDNDERITRLEERFERQSEQTRQELQSIDVRLTKIETEMATKADLLDATNSILKWVVGTIFGAGVAAVKPAPLPPTSPVIIQVPPASQVVPRP
jgi:hypothetical protein